MINLNTYIIEKLHINKDTKIDTFASLLYDVFFPNKKYEECYKIFDDFAKEHDINSLDNVTIFAEKSSKRVLDKIFKKTILKNKIEYKEHDELVPYYKAVQHTEFRKFSNGINIIYVKDDILIYFDLNTSIHLTFKLKQ